MVAILQLLLLLAFYSIDILCYKYSLVKAPLKQIWGREWKIYCCLHSLSLKLWITKFHVVGTVSAEHVETMNEMRVAYATRLLLVLRCRCCCCRRWLNSLTSAQTRTWHGKALELAPRLTKPEEIIYTLQSLGSLTIGHSILVTDYSVRSPKVNRPRSMSYRLDS